MLRSMSILFLFFLFNLSDAAPMRPTDEKYGMENPSAAEMHHFLRRLFRSSSQEMDQTGFHEPEEESRDFLPPAQNPGTIAGAAIGHDKKAPIMALSPTEDSANVAFMPEKHDDAEVEVSTGAAILSEEFKDPDFKIPKASESNQDTDPDLVAMKNDPVHVHVNSSSDSMGPCPHVSHSAQNLEGEDGNEASTNDAQAQPLEISIEIIPNVSKNLHPPPFLVTKPFNGRNYVYQHRYPTPEQGHGPPEHGHGPPEQGHQGHAAPEQGHQGHGPSEQGHQGHEAPEYNHQDSATSEERFLSQLNGKNVFGPLFPLDLTKLHQDSAKAPPNEATSSTSINPGFQHEGYQEPPTFFMLFFHMCPHHAM